jgi:hypothetical protein
LYCIPDPEPPALQTTANSYGANFLQHLDGKIQRGLRWWRSLATTQDTPWPACSGT